MIVPPAPVDRLTGSVLMRASSGAQEVVGTVEADYAALGFVVPDWPEPVEVLMRVPLVIITVAASTAQFKMCDAANAVHDGGKAIGFVKTDAANGHDSAIASFWIEPHSGPITVKVRKIFAQVGGLGACNANFGGSSRAFLIARSG